MLTRGLVGTTVSCRILEVQPKHKKKAKARVSADLQQVLQQHGVNSFDQ